VCKNCSAEHDGGFNGDFCSQACLSHASSEQLSPPETLVVAPVAAASELPVKEPTPAPAAESRSRPRREARSSPTAAATGSSSAEANSLDGMFTSGSPRGSSAGGDGIANSSTATNSGSGKKNKRAAAAAAAAAAPTAQPPVVETATSITTPRASKASTKATPKAASKSTPQATPKTPAPKTTTPKATPAPKVYKDPALAKLSKVDAKMMSKRRVRDAVSDVPYDFELVPACAGASLRPWPPATAPSTTGKATEVAKESMDDDIAPEVVAPFKPDVTPETAPMQDADEAATTAATTTAPVSDAPVVDDDTGNVTVVPSGDAGDEVQKVKFTPMNRPEPLLPEPPVEAPLLGPEPPPGMLAGSVLVKVYDREVWAASLTELLLLCSEAAWRRVIANRRKAAASPLVASDNKDDKEALSGKSAQGNHSSGSLVTCSTDIVPVVPSSAQQPQPGDGAASFSSMVDAQGMLPVLAGATGGAPDAKPLTLEYMADRLDTDDPTWGYMVRQETTGWLQGFVLLTDFTTWSSYFRFDSTAASTGITADDWAARRCDLPTPRAPRGTLATLLDAEPRWGDPFEEGVVFRRVAEMSLLGGLGCGAWLLHLALQDCKQQGYKYAVLQATDQAIPFYEQMGFVRVGCVARHAKDNDGDGNSSQSQGLRPGKEGNNNTAGSSNSSCSPSSSKATKSPKSSKPLTKGLAAGLQPPPVPLDVSPDDGYYWLAQWMAFLCEQFKLLDEDQVFCVAVDEVEVPNYRLVCPYPPVDLGLMGRRAVANRYYNECT